MDLMMCLSEVHCNWYSQGYFVCTDISITWITRPYISSFVLVLLATVLFVLWFTDSDFPFGILRLFLLRICFFYVRSWFMFKKGKIVIYCLWLRILHVATMKMFLPFVNNIIGKRLKIPQGSSEAANRKSGNAITNRKPTQGQTMIYRTQRIILY